MKNSLYTRGTKTEQAAFREAVDYFVSRQPFYSIDRNGNIVSNLRNFRIALRRNHKPKTQYVRRVDTMSVTLNSNHKQI